MVRLSEDEINEVRNKADIGEIIGRYIPLIKKGKSLTAVCPFHDDHNPSLSISQDKQIYKCFVCGNGGNVFTFVQNIEKITFVEAVLKVAQYCNIDLGYQVKDLISSRYDDVTKGYFKLLNEVIAFQQYQLNSVGGNEVKEYLSKRGYDDDIIKYFDIGFNPGNDSLHKFLTAKGYLDKDMITLNVIRNTDGVFHDVFSERITFPIFDKYGSPIAFSARTIKPQFEPKYINTSETLLYTKGNVLYNYHRAAPDVKLSHCVFVVEGVTDVIALYKAGYTNVVATLGTALSKQQIVLLKQLSLNIVLCYDGDEAGQNANYKNGQALISEGVNVMVINNETNKDPDDIIRDDGIATLKEILASQMVWIEFVMNHLIKKYDLHNYNQKKNYSIDVIKEIIKLPENFDQKNFLQRLSILTEFDINQLGSLMNELQPNKPKNKPQQFVRVKQILLNGGLRAEYEILSQMLNSREACEYFKEKIGFLPTDINNRLAMLILDNNRKQQQFVIADFLSFIEDEQLKSLIMNIWEWEYLPKAFNPAALDDAYSKIKVGLIEEKINTIKQKQKVTVDMKLKQHLTKELIDLKKEKITIQESCSKEKV